MRDGLAIEGAGGAPSGPSPWRVNHVVTAVIAVAALALGVTMGRATGSDDIVPAAEVVAVADLAPPPETQVAGAVEIRRGDLVPVATDHLVVVSVSANTCGERATGSGVLVAPDLILSAAHVVGDAGLVRIDHGGQILTAEVLGVFEDGRDLALLTLPAPLDGPISIGAVPALGEPVTIVGHPGGGSLTSIVGPVVDVPHRASIVLRGDLIGVGALPPQGMSGGPAVDAHGEVVGVVVASQPGTDTAIIATFDDVKSLIDAPLTEGRCAEVA